jgi:hypothetical protein
MFHAQRSGFAAPCGAGKIIFISGRSETLQARRLCSEISGRSHRSARRGIGREIFLANQGERYGEEDLSSP